MVADRLPDNLGRNYKTAVGLTALGPADLADVDFLRPADLAGTDLADAEALSVDNSVDYNWADYNSRRVVVVGSWWSLDLSDESELSD